MSTRYFCYTGPARPPRRDDSPRASACNRRFHRPRSQPRSRRAPVPTRASRGAECDAIVSDGFIFGSRRDAPAPTVLTPPPGVAAPRRVAL